MAKRSGKKKFTIVALVIVAAAVMATQKYWKEHVDKLMAKINPPKK